jgi:hypothetical protein
MKRLLYDTTANTSIGFSQEFSQIFKVLAQHYLQQYLSHAKNWAMSHAILLEICDQQERSRPDTELNALKERQKQRMRHTQAAIVRVENAVRLQALQAMIHAFQVR